MIKYIKISLFLLILLYNNLIVNSQSILQATNNLYEANRGSNNLYDASRGSNNLFEASKRGSSGSNNLFEASKRGSSGSNNLFEASKRGSLHEGNVRVGSLDSNRNSADINRVYKQLIDQVIAQTGDKLGAVDYDKRDVISDKYEGDTETPDDNLPIGRRKVRRIKIRPEKHLDSTTTNLDTTTNRDDAYYVTNIESTNIIKRGIGIDGSRIGKSRGIGTDGSKIGSGIDSSRLSNNGRIDRKFETNDNSLEQVKEFESVTNEYRRDNQIDETTKEYTRDFPDKTITKEYSRDNRVPDKTKEYTRENRVPDINKMVDEYGNKYNEMDLNGTSESKETTKKDQQDQEGNSEQSNSKEVRNGIRGVDNEESTSKEVIKGNTSGLGGSLGNDKEFIDGVGGISGTLGSKVITNSIRIVGSESGIHKGLENQGSTNKANIGSTKSSESNKSGESSSESFKKLFANTYASGYLSRKKHMLKNIVLKRCHNKYSFLCFKFDLMKIIDKLNTTDQFTLLPGVHIIRHTNISTTTQPDIPNSLIISILRNSTSTSDSTSYQLDQLLLQKLKSYLSQLSVHVKLLDTTKMFDDYAETALTESVGGGRTFFSSLSWKDTISNFMERSKKQNYGHAAIWSAGTLAALAFAALAALSGKALITSILALVLAAMCAFKGHHGHGGYGNYNAALGKTSHYEIITKPAHYHDHEHLHSTSLAAAASPYASYARQLVTDRLIPTLSFDETQIDPGDPYTYVPHEERTV